MKYNLKKTKLYELRLTVSLDKVDLDGYIGEAQKYLANDLRIKGFREGKAPLEVAKDKLDKKLVSQTTLDLAFRQSFADVLVKEKLELLDAGAFEVKENSAEALIYSVLLTIFPEFKLPNYKRINVERKQVSVSKEEVDGVLGLVRKSRAKNDQTPELNDEFAKSLGHFNNVEELRKNVEEGLKEEKEIKESQRVQGQILDKIAEKTKIEVPPLLVNRQLDQMIVDLDSNLHQQGLELGLWLAKVKKTQEELRKEWEPKAKTLVKKALILKKIAKVEKISIEPQEVKDRINGLLQNFASVEETEQKINLPKLNEQIHQVLLNEKVLKFLENLNP